MIRTRDVYVLASCLFVLGFAILATIFLRYGSLSEKAVPLLTGTSSSEVVYTAKSIEHKKNRNTTIERLRSLIARGDTTVVPSPSVEEEVIIPTATTSAEDGIITSELVTCGGDDSRTVIASWPASVEVSTATGNRIVSVLVSNPAYTPSTTTVSTEEEFISKTLMTTRAFPVKGQTPQCVPGAIVGITASGGLIQNDASYYKEYGSDSLIGYARDGFPIYGFYEGAVDACGGYQHVNGYRYTLTQGRNTVLNCFFSTPSVFTL